MSAGIEGTVQGIASVKAGSDSFQQGLKEQASQYASAAGKATAAQNAYASAAQAAKTALATYQANPTAENLQKVSDGRFPPWTRRLRLWRKPLAPPVPIRR